MRNFTFLRRVPHTPKSSLTQFPPPAEARARDVATSTRMARMAVHREAFTIKLRSERGAAHTQRLAAFKDKLAAEREKRLAERRQQRVAKRRQEVRRLFCFGSLCCNLFVLCWSLSRKVLPCGRALGHNFPLLAEAPPSPFSISYSWRLLRTNRS